MPYRRLPNTDQARMRAIELALEKGKRTARSELAFSQQGLEGLQTLYPHFSGAMRNLQASKQNQFDHSNQYGVIFKKAKLYISHFIQVLNFAIIREEMKPEVRKFYELNPDLLDVPSLNLEEDILIWGDRIIEGEKKRCMHGGSPIYSPSIALVKVHVESFKDAYHFMLNLEKINKRASVKMQEMRDKADVLIQQIWNEIEGSFSTLSPEIRRENARQYGITYVYRASEQKKMEAEKLQTNLIFN